VLALLGDLGLRELQLVADEPGDLLGGRLDQFRCGALGGIGVVHGVRHRSSFRRS
jgi:hypothetical protein